MLLNSEIEKFTCPKCKQQTFHYRISPPSTHILHCTSKGCEDIGVQGKTDMEAVAKLRLLIEEYDSSKA